ncbi:MAG TPA: ABC transporter permease [Microthrixaceae bacterium]|nr:ABC transporter permease [Microthrixaceae bacterium]
METSDTGALGRAIAGLDVIELAGSPSSGKLRDWWSLLWPKLAAVAISLLIWQLVVWSGWKPSYVLPGPGPVFGELWKGLTDGVLLRSSWITMQRAVIGYSLALSVGIIVGALVSQFRVLRIAVGSMITGLQTMPSIAWFPLAILLFKLSEQAILFVIVLGAAPAIANGLIAGTDNIPPVLLRAGHVLGARGFTLYRNIVLPASLPSFVSGMKQGWAFAWRSLLAGELLVIIASRPSIGMQLQVSRDLADATGLMATMIAILAIGIIVDSLFFGKLELAIRRRWGLIDQAGG